MAEDKVKEEVKEAVVPAAPAAKPEAAEAVPEVTVDAIDRVHRPDTFIARVLPKR